MNTRPRIMIDRLGLNKFLNSRDILQSGIEYSIEYNQYFAIRVCFTFRKEKGVDINCLVAKVIPNARLQFSMTIIYRQDESLFYPQCT